MEITSYIVIGAIVSLVVQFIKTKYGTNTTSTLLAVIGISVISGIVYFFIKETPLWEPIISILGFAGAVYTYFIKRFEEDELDY